MRIFKLQDVYSLVESALLSQDTQFCVGRVLPLDKSKNVSATARYTICLSGDRLTGTL